MKLFLLPAILFSITTADVENAVFDHLNTHFPLTDAEYVCDFSRLNSSRFPDADSVSIDGYGKDVPRGQVVVYFSFYENQERIYKTTGTVRVGILKRVLTSSMPIKAGDPITGDNTRYEIRDIASEPEEPLVSRDDLLYRVASKFIPAGRIINRSMSKLPPVVSPGDNVEIIYNSGHFNLKTNGVVKQEGSAGDKIRVMNIDTRKVIYGTVVDSATVRINEKEGI